MPQYQLFPKIFLNFDFVCFINFYSNFEKTHKKFFFFSYIKKLMIKFLKNQNPTLLRFLISILII